MRKRRAATTDLARILQETLAAEGGQSAREIVQALIEAARKGNVPAMKELLAQLESVPTEKPRMTVEVVFRDPPWS